MVFILMSYLAQGGLFDAGRIVAVHQTEEACQAAKVQIEKIIQYEPAGDAAYQRRYACIGYSLAE